MFIINNSISASDPQKYTSRDSLSSSVSKWHPKMFYIVLPDLSFKFILPYEPDQSGFYNIFFISKESGETLLLDSIENNIRHFTPFSSGSCYDVILLYNNGKYVKHNDVIFENDAEVDMSNQHVQQSDSLSERWKTMRYFENTLYGRALDRDDMPVSDYIIKGYVFGSSKNNSWIIEDDSTDWNWVPTVLLYGNNTIKRKICTFDGYFEFDVEGDSERRLGFSANFHGLEKHKMTAPCGLIFVMRSFGKAQQESRDSYLQRMFPEKYFNRSGTNVNKNK